MKTLMLILAMAGVISASPIPQALSDLAAQRPKEKLPPQTHDITTTSVASITPPGAVARTVSTNPVVVTPLGTNRLGLGWFSGIGKSNGIAYLQSSTTVSNGYTNAVPFTMGDSNVVVIVTFTNPARFFRLAWNTNDLAR